MSNIINTIILDLDGPLLDGMHRHYSCYSDILRKHRFKPIPINQYWELKRNRVDRRQLLALSKAVELYDTFLISWIENIESKQYLALDRLQTGVIDTLSNWKKSGMRLLLVTMRNNLINLNWQLVEFQLAQFLDEVVIVGTSQTGESKSIKIKPLLVNQNLEEVIWIGDTEVDVHAAHELGIKVCALSNGLRTSEYLASLTPDFLEKDLSSFAIRDLKI